MHKIRVTNFLPLATFLTFLGLSTTPAKAEQFGLFTYEIRHGSDEIEITGYPTTEVGGVQIPSEIEGKPVTSIGNSAFQDRSGLTSITIPDSVTSIGRFAFDSCYDLLSIPLPANVSSIGSYAFADCTSLISIEVDPLNQNYSDLDGVLFDKSGTELIGYPRGRPGGYFVPESVTTIGEGAFNGCNNLTNISFPASLTSVGPVAFSGCSELTFVSIPQGVTVIDDGAFSFCTGLIAVSIPETVTSIGEGAFAGCFGLTSIEVNDLNPNYQDLNDVLLNKDGSILIGYPAGRSGAYTIPNGVNSIGGGAFSYCTGLTSISIPMSVTSIGRDAFRGCSHLTSVTIPAGVTEIESGAFLSCSALTAISIPTGVSIINAYTFYGCTDLASVDFPPGITEIGSLAFYDCASLSSVSISENVTSIGYEAFNECSNLQVAIFIGNAPSALQTRVFGNAAPDFTVYYLSESWGFTSPTWNGYPAEEIDTETYPAGPWLLTHGLPLDIDLNQDLNGDGVTLLMAYALNLDPNLPSGKGFPVPVVGQDGLSITFYAGAAGVAYTTESSVDLVTWTTEGVTLSEPDAQGRRTATVERNGPARFIRLAVDRS